MAIVDRKSLPAPARNLIKKLEMEVSRLERTLDKARAEVRRHRPDVAAGNARTLLDARRAEAEQVARRKTTEKTGLSAAVAQGEAAKMEWIRTGEVVSAKTLADAWGLTPQALGPAADRGEVFALVIKRQRYFPAEFLQLNRDGIAAVCKALGDLTPSEKLIFWKRPHGGLGSKTVLQALGGKHAAESLPRVTQLASTWAAEARARSDAGETT